MINNIMNRLINKRFLLVVALILVLGIAGMFGWNIYQNNGPIILMYHHLAPEGTYEESNNAILSVEKFDEQMKWLKENNYNTMLLSEVQQYMAERKELPHKAVVITFDDGYESNYVYGFQILQKYDLKANMAVVVRPTELRDEKPDESEYDPNSLRHMTFEQLKIMSDSGLVEIGSHSYDGHGQVNVDNDGETKPFFTNRKYDTINKTRESKDEYYQRIQNDMIKSKDILEANIGTEIRYFAYPYGRCTNVVVDAAKEAGFKVAVTVKHGAIKEQGDEFLLPRYNVDTEITLDEFIDLVNN